MNQIRGMQQCLAYNSSATRLYFTVRDDQGMQVAPDAAPQITIYDPGGDSIRAAEDMSNTTPVREGWLAYDGGTASFSVGALATDGTSGATGYITMIQDDGTTGTLYLSNIKGTFGDDQAITDSDGGAATVNGTLSSYEYYEDIDTTSTSTFDTGRNYMAKITYAVSSQEYEFKEYFDIAPYPMSRPMVLSSDVDRLRPQWVQSRPDWWYDWTPAIQDAHREIVNRIHGLGEYAADYVKRESEFYRIELQFVWWKIAASCGFPMDEVDKWEQRAEAVWNSKGLFTINTDDDDEIEDDMAAMPSSKWVR